ncbi:MAG: sigma-54 interaction domain-containing protein [Aminipila sp.]
MLTKYFEYISQIYERVDALIIINKDGIIEYSVTYNSEMNGFVNDGYVGKHVLEVYPLETQDTSNHYKVMKNGEPIINETETVVDVSGKSFTFVNSTFPIEHNNEIIGTIEVSRLAYTREDTNIKTRFKNKESNSLYSLDDIITANPVMLEIKEKMKKVANSESPVLICGDTGTGKELVAQAIHNQSRKQNGPFISLNCSAIPVTILESLLFGTVKGSFTGAENKKGLFEMANKGTLFLDELNSMDISVQSKILKAIEEKAIRRVGGETPIVIDIRFIAAMNADPYEAIKCGILRKDLYYRLSVIQVTLPPLVERREDIELLVGYYISKYNMSMKKDITGINDIVKEIFNDYPWPGNIRELRNAIEYAFNMTDGKVINLKDLPEHLLLNSGRASNLTNNISQSINTEISLKEQVEQFEKEILKKALSNSRNHTEAARKLKLTRQAFQYKLEKYGL